MIYLQNNEVIKIEVLQNLPKLETPVIDGVETGATVTLETQFTIANLPTGATLYVNGVAKSGNTFTITPDPTASTKSYLYTINLQFKGLSGYSDSEIASYSFTVKNAAPTVNQNSQVTTSASLTVAISRTDTTYVSDLDVKYGVGTDTTTGNSGTSVTITNTSVNSQYNFWCNATSYADKSDIVTKYYHVAGSEKLPTPTISYDETNENFTINIASFPSDPDLGNYMSSTGYTIYYSLNSETIDTQYNNIAVSCDAGDVIRAKVSSSYGWQDSDIDVYEVESSIATSISFDKATYNINKGYTKPVNNMSFSAFTVTDNLGNDVTDAVTLNSVNGMIIYANNKHLIPITPGTDTITASYTPSGGTALTATCTVNSKNTTNIYNYGSASVNTLPITISDTNSHDYQIKIVDNNNNEGYFGTITVTNVSSSNSSAITASVLSGGAGFTVQGVSSGNATITITFTASNVGTCTYQVQFAYGEAEPETPTLGDGFDGFYALSNGDSFQYSPTNGTYIQYLGINGSYTYWTDSSEELVEIYDSTLASAVESAELTPGQFVDPNGFTATKSIYQNKHQLNTVSGLSFSSQYIDIDDGNPYEESTFESLSATTLALTNVDTSHYENYNEYYKLSNVKIVDAAEDGITFVAYDVNQNTCIVFDQMGVFANETLNYDSTQYDVYGFISTYRGMSEFYPVLIQESETQNSAFANQYNVTVLKGLDLVGQNGEIDTVQTRQLSLVSSNNDSGLNNNVVKYGNGTGINITNNAISKVVIVDSNYNSVTSQGRCMTISTDGNTTTNMTAGNAGACTFTAANINSSSDDVVQIANANSVQVNVLVAIIVESYRTYSLQPVWYDNITHEWYDAQLNHHDSNAGLFWYDEAPTSDCCIAVMVRDNTGAPYEPSQSAHFATTAGTATTWTYGWYFSNVQQRHPGQYYDDKYWGEGGIEVSNVNGSGADTIACGYRYGESKKYNPVTIFNGTDSIWTQTIGEQIYYMVFDYTLTHRCIYDSNKGTKPASITITSSDTSVFTVSNNGRYIESVGYGEATIELTYTVGNDSYIYQSTAMCEEYQPEMQLWFPGFEEGVEAPVGSEIEAPLYYGTPGDDENEVNDSENCTLSSDDESVATVEWHDMNEGEEEPIYVPKITCVGEGQTTIVAEYEGLIAMLPITVTAAE